METSYNEKTHKHEWVMKNWFDKFVVIIGYSVLVLSGISFVAGMMVGIANI